jgi:hypothetical protein
VLDSSAAAATAAFALRFTALEERCGRVEAAAQAAVQAADARAQAAEARAVAAEAALRGAPTHLLTRAQPGAGTPPPAASPVDGKLAETVASLVTWRSEFEANVVRVFCGLRETVAAEAAAQSSKLDALAALVRPLAEAAAAARPPGFVAERAAVLNASTLRASAATPSVAMRSPLPSADPGGVTAPLAAAVAALSLAPPLAAAAASAPASGPPAAAMDTQA